MEKKPGRNDPCPCGSGKKYKQCHMLQEEEAKKTYTPGGKRKFKASVLSSTDKASSIFQTKPAPKSMEEVNPHYFLKVKLTDTDYRNEFRSASIPLPFPIGYYWDDIDFDMPEKALEKAVDLPETYQITSTDYRVEE